MPKSLATLFTLATVIFVGFELGATDGHSSQNILIGKDTMTSQQSMSPSPISSSVSLGTYHNYSDMTTLLRNVVNTCPNIMRLYSIGQSVQGRELWVVQITSSVNSVKPQFKYVGNMHGDEVIGREMLLYLISHLCDEYGSSASVTDLIDRTDIHILVSMNPDGFELHQRGNANGVDLNRNFPDQFRDPVNSDAGRQPETAAVMKWTNEQHFVMSANLHGGALVANYPYDGNVPDDQVYSRSPDDKIFRQMALNYSMSHTVMHLSTEFKDGITNGAEWYTLYGGMQDWNYVYANGMEITLELSDIKWPDAYQLPLFWEQNRQALLNLIGIHGKVTSEDGATLAATVGIDTISHIIRNNPDNGVYYRPLAEGYYTVTAYATGYTSQSKTVTIHGFDSVTLDFTLTPVGLPNILIFGVAITIILVLTVSVTLLIWAIRRCLARRAEASKVFHALDESQLDWRGSNVTPTTEVDSPSSGNISMRTLGPIRALPVNDSPDTEIRHIMTPRL